ncbi:perforin-like protein 1 [Plasmodium chabaudi adami]|uniref:Perforin-like protein 1 n=1 Tax=Plasmodium chabaudi adami TaxID=5826 RepID=A0A1D3LK02_PLACE|nr:perforin-like protein 1 [Plasmodium chabaudi adami]
MKKRNIKKSLPVLFILLCIYQQYFINSIRISVRHNKNHRDKNNEDKFNKNMELGSMGSPINILCSGILCNTGNNISFVNQKKNEKDSDSDLYDMLDDDASTSAGDDEDDEDDYDDYTDDKNAEIKDEKQNEQIDKTDEKKDKKGTFSIKKKEDEINENKNKTEQFFKKYKFNDADSEGDDDESDTTDETLDSSTPNSPEEDTTTGNVIDKHMAVFPGLYFVGIGYDILFGNPLGETDSLSDPGYRAQIYLLNWEFSNHGIANDLHTLQPINAWIRKENACSRVESINECSSVSEYTKNLSVDVSVSGSYMGFGSFSASTGYKKFINEVSKRTSKTYFIKSNCIKYTIGLPPYVPWEQTTAYMNAVGILPKEFTGLNEDSECAPDVYEQKKMTKQCKNVHQWIQFFKTYGTHIIVEAQLGGKITKIINVSNTAVNQMKKDGVSVKAQIQAQFGFASVGGSTSVSSDNSSKNDNSSYDMSEKLVVIGGNPIKDVTKEENLYEWSKTVSSNPMPIHIKLLPIYKSFDSEELKESYEQAVLYYTRLYGSSPHGTIQKDENDIIKILTASTTITKIGAPPITAECPHNQVVLFGYVLKQNFWDNTSKLKGYDIEICESGLNSCTSKQGSTNKYDVSYLYIECGTQAMAFSDQVITTSNTTYNTIKCPNDYTIIFGFGFSSSSGKGVSAMHTHITSCRPGMKSCSLNMGNSNDKNYMYLVCVDATIWSGINELSIVAKDDFHGAVDRSKQFNDGQLVLNCQENGTILTGFAGETHTSSPYVKSPFSKCLKNLKSCSVHGSGQSIGYTNYKSLFSIILCKNGE